MTNANAHNVEILYVLGATPTGVALNAKIRAFINGWNDRSHPFVWTKTSEEILKKANRQKTSNTDH